WDKCNVIVLVWEELEETYDKVDGYPLPDVRNAYAIISSEESHKVVVFGSHASTSHRSQSSVFVSNVVGKGNFQSFYEVLDLPNDKRRHTSATIYDINFSHIGSPTSAQIKNELGHSLGFSSSTSENDKIATCEDNNINSEGNDGDVKNLNIEKR
ncbi:hypothetical protein Tco_1443237, partial [Tanacetum coccineum]